MIPSERSSGETERRGGITKAGNALARSAHRVRMALLHVLPEAQGPSPGTDVPRRYALGRTTAPPGSTAAANGRGGQERVQGQRRRGARARLLGLGDRVPGGGDPRLTPSDNKPPAGGPAPRRIAGAFTNPFGQPKGRAREQDWFRTSAPDGESKCGGVRGHTGLTAGSARKSPRILACRASVD